MDIKEFDALLAGHDWYYQYSDDHGVWSRGNARWDRIQSAKKLSSDHELLYSAYVNSTNSPSDTSRQQRAEIRKSLGL